MPPAAGFEIDASAMLRELAAELHDFVSHVQAPRSGDGAWREAARTRCRALADRARQMRATAAPRGQSLAGTLEDVSHGLRDFEKELGKGSPASSTGRMGQISKRVAYAYEALLAELRATGNAEIASAGPGVALGHLKPRNYARNLYHVANSLGGVLLYEFVLTRQTALWVVGAFLAFVVAMEVSRRFSRRWNRFLVEGVFGAVSRPRELTQINSASWFTLAMFIAVLLCDQRAAQLGVLTVGLGDPIASLIGKRFGTIHLWRGKSLQGSLAFALSAFLALNAFLALFSGDWDLGRRLAITTTVALAGALTELFSDRVDDNLSVTLIAAGVAQAWL